MVVPRSSTLFWQRAGTRASNLQTKKGKTIFSPPKRVKHTKIDVHKCRIIYSQFVWLNNSSLKQRMESDRIYGSQVEIWDFSLFLFLLWKMNTPAKSWELACLQRLHGHLFGAQITFFDLAPSSRECREWKKMLSEIWNQFDISNVLEFSQNSFYVSSPCLTVFLRVGVIPQSIHRDMAELLHVVKVKISWFACWKEKIEGVL